MIGISFVNNDQFIYYIEGLSEGHLFNSIKFKSKILIEQREYIWLTKWVNENITRNMI